MSLNLAYVNSQGHVILKVDNTTNVTIGENRNAVGSWSSVPSPSQRTLHRFV